MVIAQSMHSGRSGRPSSVLSHLFVQLACSVLNHPDQAQLFTHLTYSTERGLQGSIAPATTPGLQPLQATGQRGVHLVAGASNDCGETPVRQKMIRRAPHPVGIGPLLVL